MLLQSQSFVMVKRQLDVFQFPHWFLEVAQLHVQQQDVSHVLVVVLECQELSPLYTRVKILFILLLIYTLLTYSMVQSPS